MSVCYLLQMTVSSASEWKGSAEHQQEAEHCTAVNGTSSNTSFSHLKDGPQKNVEMFMLRYILEFWGTLLCCQTSPLALHSYSVCIPSHKRSCCCTLYCATDQLF